MHFPSLTVLITALAAVAAAAPNPNPKAPSAPNGANNDPDQDMRSDAFRQHSITVFLQSEPYLVIESTIGIQLECKALNKKQFPNGVLGIQVPEGYHCRFWKSTECNGGGTANIRAPGEAIEPELVKELNSFKCYESEGGE
ncbi:uncharacterized protein DSM5745_02697 [Aspergillus mulundensis]|uniref:Uncharacterized protein n=1 Tax=Aspergillus mulundensis TaxID=1810919 RepID=A0A3D8SI74_9EURO|nr:hypothetical protein DSM5745_02697 [Aspergillus mulundensis]RDW86055.1 hypothetical protein DSM5745_02697 [Aspergillus mulundensis]